MSEEMILFVEAAKKYFLARKKIFFHNKNYKMKIDEIKLNINRDMSRDDLVFCFYLRTEDKNIKEILTKNYYEDGREGGKISFDNTIYDCHNFDVRNRDTTYNIICGFRIGYINIRENGLQALAGEHYDGEEEKKNIKYNRFDIMDI